MKTINADATLDSTSPTIPPGTVPSIIKIPPQLATTVVWIVVGVGIGWYLFRPKPRTINRTFDA